MEEAGQEEPGRWAGAGKPQEHRLAMVALIWLSSSYTQYPLGLGHVPLASLQRESEMWWGRGSPSVATSPMGTLCFCAMYPRKEKTTKPEEKLVRELIDVVMIASL